MRLYWIYKKHKTIAIISPIHFYISRINNRLVFKIKDGYKLELQMSETIELFGSTEKLIEKTKKIKKNGENVPILEVVKVVLVYCSWEDNQYEQRSEVLYTFMPNKYYAYLLNIEPSNLVFLETYDTEFD